jgi:hypothetical protein
MVTPGAASHSSLRLGLCCLPRLYLHSSTLILSEVEVILWLMAGWTVSLDIRHPPGVHYQILITVRHLHFSSRGAPSLMRGQACNLLVQLYWALSLLGPSPAEFVRLGSLFVASCDAQVCGGYWSHPTENTSSHVSFIVTLHTSAKWYYCWLCFVVYAPVASIFTVP